MEEDRQQQERRTWETEKERMAAELATVKVKLAESVRALKAREGPPLLTVQPGAACGTCVKRVEEIKRMNRDWDEEQAKARTERDHLKEACTSAERLLHALERRQQAEKRAHLDQVAELEQKVAGAERRAAQAEQDRNNLLILIKSKKTTPEETLRAVSELEPTPPRPLARARTAVQQDSAGRARSWSGAATPRRHQ